MHRIQAQLPEETVRRLRIRAAQEGVSIAELLRRGADLVLEEDTAEEDRDRRWRRAMAVVGRYSGDGGNVAERHDEYLEEAYGDWPSS